MADKKRDTIYVAEGGIYIPFLGVLGGKIHKYEEPSDSLAKNPDIVIQQTWSWGGKNSRPTEIAKYYPEEGRFIVGRVTGEGRFDSNHQIVIPADPKTVNGHPALRGRVRIEPR